MTIREQLGKLSSAEDFFLFLQVPFEPTVVNVARLHILRRMGEYMRSSPSAPAEEIAFEYYRAQLERAYRDFVVSSPMVERVFKVHQQAVQPPPMPLVSITTGAMK